VARQIALAVAACIGLGGCGSTALLTGTRPAAPSRPGSSEAADAVAANAYMRSLGIAQARLGASERAIPRRPRTQRDLVRAIGLLKRAIRRLSNDLEVIGPPEAIRGLHAQLVGIVGLYASSLAHAARVAARPSGELSAARLLSSATTRASENFSATVARIDRTLAR
jgi:hypothetical protein